MQTWRDKAHRIISDLCRQSYLQAETTKAGKRRKRHVPYSVPQAAQDLIDCIKTNNEERAKAIFLFNYDVVGITRD
jgi:hypothetical protein